jgi:hypothetical protein
MASKHKVMIDLNVILDVLQKRIHSMKLLLQY